QLPADGEVAGLLALMLLTNARRPARTTGDGMPVSLPEQDRHLWVRADIVEGTAVLEEGLRQPARGTYRLQASIAALRVPGGRSGRLGPRRASLSPRPRRPGWSVSSAALSGDDAEAAGACPGTRNSQDHLGRTAENPAGG